MSIKVLSLPPLSLQNIVPPDLEKDQPASRLNASLDSPSGCSESITPRFITWPPEDKRKTAFLLAASFIEKNSEIQPWTQEEQNELIELFLNAPKIPWNYVIEMASLLIQGDDLWTPDNKIELLKIFSVLFTHELEDLVKFTKELSDAETYSPEDILATLALLAGLEPEKRRHFTAQIGDFFQRVCLQRQKRSRGNLSPKSRILICEEFTKLYPLEKEIVFVLTTSLLEDYVGSELSLLKAIIRRFSSKNKSFMEDSQAKRILKTYVPLSNSIPFSNSLKRDLAVFLNIEDGYSLKSCNLIDNTLEIFYPINRENPRDILKQISTLFERGKWDQCNRQSALELLANLSSLERSALIRQSTLLYDSESGDSNGILEIIKTLLRIECPFREDIVQKTLVFIGDTPYRNDEIIKALQIIDGIVEFERPSVLKDLEIALEILSKVVFRPLSIPSDFFL